MASLFGGLGGGKLRYLAGNMGWMTISNFASKILVLLMVPYYTRVLTADGYGIYDLGYTAVTLLAPIVTANSGEALMRFSITDRDKTSAYFSSAFAISSLASGIALVAGGLTQLLPLSPLIMECLLGTAVYLSASIQYILFTQFARGIDKVRDMAIGGVINSTVLFSASFVLMSGFRLGVMGSFLAGFLGCLAGTCYLAVKCKAWRYLVRPSAGCLRQLVEFGIPLSVNSLGWWVNNSFSRYAVAFLCGASSAGLLAAAYKIPSIPKVIQQIFIQAWQISSVKDFDPNDGDGFFSGVYNAMCCLSSLLTSAVIMVMPLIATVMFSSEFFEAWRYVPLLMMCIVFDCLASIIGGVFSAVGNTRPIAFSAFVSVFVVVLACFILIPTMGVQGAALASVLSSVVIWAMRLVLVRSYIRICINWKSFAVYVAALSIQVALSLALELSPVWCLVQTCCFTALIAFSVFFVIRPMLKCGDLGKS